MMEDHPQAEAAAANALTMQDFWGEVDHFCDVLVPDTCVIISPDAGSLGMLLARLRRSIALLRDAATYVEDEMCKVMPGKEVMVQGVGVAEMHTGASRKAWDKEALVDVAAHVVADVVPSAVIPESGEFINEIQVARDVLGVFLEMSTPSWKVTGLRKYKVNPDEFCETTWGRKTIQMPSLPSPRDEAGPAEDLT